MRLYFFCGTIYHVSQVVSVKKELYTQVLTSVQNTIFYWVSFQQNNMFKICGLCE